MTSIRPADEADLKAIVDIQNHEIRTSTASFTLQPVDIDDRKIWLEGLIKDGYPCLVAEIEEKQEDIGEFRQRTIGWCNVSRYRSKEGYNATAEITLYIHKDFRGQRVGKQLLDAILTEARVRGFHTIIAMVSAENELTCRFWEKHGFEKCGFFRQAYILAKKSLS